MSESNNAHCREAASVDGRIWFWEGEEDQIPYSQAQGGGESAAKSYFLLAASSCHEWNITTCDTQIVQFAFRKSAQFRDSATETTPLLVFANEVHRSSFQISSGGLAGTIDR